MPNILNPTATTIILVHTETDCTCLMSSYSMVISNCIDTQRWKSLTRNLSIFVRQMSFEDFFCYRHVAGDMILGKIVESKEFLTHGGLVDKTPSPLSFSFVLSTFAFALSLVDWSLCRLSSKSTLNRSIKIHSRFHYRLAQFGKGKMQNLGLTRIGSKQRCNLGNNRATILLIKRLQQQCSKVSLPLSDTFVLRGCAPIL